MPILRGRSAGDYARPQPPSCRSVRSGTSFAAEILAAITCAANGTSGRMGLQAGDEILGQVGVRADPGLNLDSGRRIRRVPSVLDQPVPAPWTAIPSRAMRIPGVDPALARNTRSVAISYLGTGSVPSIRINETSQVGIGSWRSHSYNRSLSWDDAAPRSRPERTPGVPPK
jgi:hypothetical protein